MTHNHISGVIDSVPTSSVIDSVPASSVIDSVPASSVVDCGFGSQLGKTKDYKIAIC